MLNSSLNTFIGVNAKANYLMVADFGNAFGSGLDFIGARLLCFDATIGGVGFATTADTDAASN